MFFRVLLLFVGVSVFESLDFSNYNGFYSNPYFLGFMSRGICNVIVEFFVRKTLHTLQIKFCRVRFTLNFTYSRNLINFRSKEVGSNRVKNPLKIMKKL